jgi:hypothetical protein
MANLAQPHHIKRPVVILMMRHGLGIATSAARLPDQLASLDGVSDHVVCLLSALVFSTPNASDLNSGFDALRPLSSFPVVLAHLVNVLSAMLAHIILGAVLALVEVAVSHPGVLVELREWLDDLAFEACLLHGDLLYGIAILPVLNLERNHLNPLLAGIDCAGEVLWRRHVERQAVAGLVEMVAGVTALWRPGAHPFTPLDQELWLWWSGGHSLSVWLLM